MNSSAEPHSGSWNFFKLILGSKDFLLMDFQSWKKPIQEEFALRLGNQICNRRRGVGAEALLILDQAPDGNPRITQIIPGQAPIKPGFDGILVAAKYLFDGARFGTGTIPLWAGEVLEKITPLDSQNFRIELGTPTSMGQPIGTQVTAVRQTYKENLLTASALELGPQDTGVLVFLRPAAVHDMGKIKKFFGSLHGLGTRLPVLVDLASPEEITITLPKASRGKDIIGLSALAALASRLEGFTVDQVIVNHKGSPVYVEAGAAGARLWATASVSYIFAGTWTME